VASQGVIEADIDKDNSDENKYHYSIPVEAHQLIAFSTYEG
jgi:hypothetical protein